MSFVNVTPDIISQAAGDLESIGSTLSEANAVAAMPTTAVLAPGVDEVSLAITSLLGSHAQAYQALSAQAANFHAQFVNLLNAGAGQYLSAEAANVQQALASAGASLGQNTGSVLPGSAATSSGTGLFGAVQQGIGTLQANVSSGLQALAMDTSGLMNSGTLVVNTARGGTMTLTWGGGTLTLTGTNAVVAPINGLSQLLAGSDVVNGTLTVSTTDGWTIFNSGLNNLTSLFGAGTLYPAAAAVSPLAAATGGLGSYGSLVANTTANLQSIGGTFAQQTAPLLAEAAANPFGASHATLTALQTGNVQPLLNVPGQIAVGSAQLAERLAAPVSITSFALQNETLSVGLGLGLPQTLAFDALGAPVNGGIAAAQSATAFTDAVATGNVGAAFSALAGAPANIADGFLNGHTTLAMGVTLPGGLGEATAQVPFSGLLVPPEPFSVSVTAPDLPLVNTITVTGPPVGGLVPGLLNYAPQQLAGVVTQPASATMTSSGDAWTAINLLRQYIHPVEYAEFLFNQTFIGS